MGLDKRQCQQAPGTWQRLHQNPVKAGMVAEVKDYEFSSWDEYIDKNSMLFPLCDTRTVDADQRKDWRNE